MKKFFVDWIRSVVGGVEVGEVSLLFNRYGERLSHLEQRAIVTLCAYVAVADGFLGREEFREILELMSHELAMPHGAAGLLLDGVLSEQEKLSVQDAVAVLHRSLDKEQCSAIVNLLRDIALVEDGIVPEEREVLNKVRELFEL